MPFNTAPIAVDYSNEELRILVEECIVRQKACFTLKDVCSYVLYWGMEDGRTVSTDNMLHESDQLQSSDCERISHILESIVKDGRIARVEGDDIRYLKQK